ncbi:glutaredoxin family protein [Methanimicrococcus hacksteinii]|uniref:glutaredoxin family protein n=1 Tax=Methanimicrococcus hacksteinii TaxID=3028293 RepID=UPI00298F3A27|nr:glutaredoxin domain-containing protein [Methanimicrococcus sp. At1]
MSKVIIYTTDVCPKCKILKGFFQSQNVTYEEMDMSTPAALTELAVNNIFTNVAPVLQINDTFLTYKEIFDGTAVKEDQIMTLIA